LRGESRHRQLGAEVRPYAGGLSRGQGEPG
jgi:hypothetical protein